MYDFDLEIGLDTIHNAWICSSGAVCMCTLLVYPMISNLGRCTIVHSGPSHEYASVYLNCAWKGVQGMAGLNANCSAGGKSVPFLTAEICVLLLKG